MGERTVAAGEQQEHFQTNPSQTASNPDTTELKWLMEASRRLFIS